MGRVAGTMAFAEGVPARDERDGLFVVHGHACESLTDIVCRSSRYRFTVWPFRVHVDQAHLHGSKWVLEISVARIAFIAKPLGLRAPINVLFRFPDVLAPAAEAEGL